MYNDEWINLQDLPEVVKASDSIYGCLRLLGKSLNGQNSKKLKSILLELEIDTSHFRAYGRNKGKVLGPIAPDIRRQRDIDWVDEHDLREAVAQAKTKKECLRLLGKSTSGQNASRLTRLCNSYGISTDHFDRWAANRARALYDDVVEQCLCGESFITKSGGSYRRSFCTHACSLAYMADERGKANASKAEARRQASFESWRRGASPEAMTTNNGLLLSRRAKDMLKDEAGWRCSRCGWGEQNQGLSRPVLHVDHIDGDTSNNYYDNLRVLCFNCHTLTPTYGPLNKKGTTYEH